MLRCGPSELTAISLFRMELREEAPPSLLRLPRTALGAELWGQLQRENEQPVVLFKLDGGIGEQPLLLLRHTNF